MPQSPVKNGDSEGTEDKNAQTKYPYDFVNKQVKTVFDSNKYIDATDISIARTILHESVHAFLVTIFAWDPLQANVTYSTMVQDWQKRRRPDLNDIQHDEMVRTFVNDIADALQEYGLKKGYNNSRQFYEDMAWGGLEGTRAFSKLPFSDRNRISNTILIELTGLDNNGQIKTQKGVKAGC